MLTRPLETRESILHAARKLYLRGGLAEMSMRKIAAEVGISATAIYRHFRNKEAILGALVASDSRRFLEYLSRGLHGKSAAERLDLSGEGYLDFALDYPNHYRLIFMSSLEDIDMQALQEQSAEDFAPTFQFLVDRVRDCIEAEVIESSDPERSSLTIWAGCHGLVSLRLAGHFSQLSDDSFRSLYLDSIAALVRGMRPLSV